MIANPPKQLSVNIEFTSNVELRDIFDQIRREIRSNTTKLTSSVKGCKFSFVIREEPQKTELIEPVYTIEENEKASRIETINGKICLVVPSKMNYTE
jgi:hypothetical protein